MSQRWATGIVNFRTYADLERCLLSVKRQRPAPCVICVVDHDPEEVALSRLMKSHPDVLWLPGPNRGFAAGANRALRGARDGSPEVDYLLLLNADVELEPGFAATLAREMHARPDVALASGKLLRRDRRTLDSAGIRIQRTRKTWDRGASQPDRGQYDRIERVFGVSGAALMIRAQAIPALEVEGELFDEDFFSYHEDTDLAWRARLLRWSCLYVPLARAAHVRGWDRERWRKVDPAIRRHSFKNRYLEMIKNERTHEFLRDLPAILLWEGVRLGYALLRDRERIAAYADALRCARRAFAKRRTIMQRARALGPGGSALDVVAKDGSRASASRTAGERA